MRQKSCRRAQDQEAGPGGVGWVVGQAVLAGGKPSQLVLCAARVALGVGVPWVGMYGDLSGDQFLLGVVGVCRRRRRLAEPSVVAHPDRCPKNFGRESHSGAPHANGAASDKGHKNAAERSL